MIMGKYNEFPYWGEKETNINIAYEEGKFNTIACGIIISVLQNIKCNDDLIKKAYIEFTTRREKYDVIRLNMVLKEYEHKIMKVEQKQIKKKCLIITSKQRVLFANQLIKDLSIILYRFFYEEEEISNMLKKSNIYNLVIKHPIKYYYMDIKDIVDYVKNFKKNKYRSML